MSGRTGIILAIMGGEFLAAVAAFIYLVRASNRQAAAEARDQAPGPGETTDYSNTQDD